MKRGAMSPAEVAELVRLAESMAAPTPGKIARKLDRHPATVAWRMIVLGLIRRKVRYNHKDYVRPNGQVIRAFTEREDRLIEALGASGLRHKVIAERVSAETGRPRTEHAIRVRMAMLAAYDHGGAP